MDKYYRIAKNKVAEYVINSIDTGDLSDAEIAKMLIEVSLSYLKYPAFGSQGDQND